MSPRSSKISERFLFYPAAPSGVTYSVAPMVAPCEAKLSKIQCTYERLYDSTSLAMLGNFAMLCLA